MGLFKKFFSISIRKSKKRSAVDPCTASSPLVQGHLKPSQDDETEAEVSRLLRSSSGRCAAQPQFGFNSLPLRSHPTDSEIRHPKSSSTSIASISARSTYSVTIRSRTVHSRTEFPNAFPPMDASCTPKRSLTDPPRRRSKSVPITPRDKSRLLLLHQDPSVASLLNHYDDNGHLNSALFSNTPSPQNDGRAQRRRTGSTLRQLLGHPSSSDLRSSTEGDISWAEKLIGETDCGSSISSIGPRTPADTHFPHIDTLSIDDKTALSINECDTSADNQQTFSSLEVELSAISTDLAHSRTLDSPHQKPMTPQRASQVFGFLGDKKRVLESPVSRLPQPKATTPQYRRFSAESSISDTKNSHIPLRRSCTYIPQPPIPSSPLRFSSSTAAAVPPSHPMVEEPSPLQGVVSQDTKHNSPRGPCTSRIPSRQSLGHPCDNTPAGTEHPLSIQSILDERPNADGKFVSFNSVRPREMHSQIPKLRSASGSSCSSTESRHDHTPSSSHRHVVPLQAMTQTEPREVDLARIGAVYGKESETPSRLPQPVTPARPFGCHLRDLPSPASSSELSPVAKQMMADLREQRMQARRRERQAGRLGSGHSRIRC